MKKYQRIIRRVLGVIGFFLVLALSNELFRFLVVDDVQSYTRVTMHEFYHQDSIDVLFLGSSHSYRSLDPEITDRFFGSNTFNAGTSSQLPDGSCALLREVCGRYQPKTVYMEVYYGVVCDYDAGPTATYVISDYMRPSWNKYEYLWESGGQEDLVHGLILARRNWQKFFDFPYMAELLQKKFTPEYWQYAYPSYDNEYYAGKGFVYNLEEVGDGWFSSTEPFAPIGDDAIGEKSRESMEEMAKICEEEGIQLVLYSAPMPDFRLNAAGDYDSFVGQMEAFAERIGAEYVDFNLCRESYLPLDGSCFMDDNHLNGKGAERFSQVFGEYFTGSLTKEKLFYESYQEKMEQEYHDEVLGIICAQEEGVEGSYWVDAVTAEERPVYYAVYTKPKGEEEYMLLQGPSSDSTFETPNGQHGYLHICVYGDVQGTELLHQMKCNY